jgi:hypothetical protein
VEPVFVPFVPLPPEDVVLLVVEPVFVPFASVDVFVLLVVAMFSLLSFDKKSIKK